MYQPTITKCPVCPAIKSPLATVCRDCYLKAKKFGCKNTLQIRQWALDEIARKAK
jgi:hypothetical protein